MTTWTVTLKSLRKAGACVSGYNKLVCHLSGRTFTPARETHIRFKHDEPISIKTIVDSNGLDDALWATRCVSGVDRDLLLFAVWCARQVQHLMIDDRSVNSIETAERHANGKATDAELDAARDAAWAAARGAARGAAWDAARGAARAAARGAARGAAWDAAWDAARGAQREMFVRMLEGTAPWQVSGD